MYGLKKRSKQEESGVIQGAGTGTSDDIQKNVPTGSYIMPADSTQKIGTKNLKNLGKPSTTEVNVSNGEYLAAPEQLQAIGGLVLDRMKQQTHTPVDQPQLGFKPGQYKPEMYFANGGLVSSAYPSADDVRRAQQSRIGGPQMRDVSGITRDVNRPLPATSTTASTSPNVRFPQLNTPTTGQMFASSAKNIAGGLAKTHGVGAMLGGAYTGFQTPTEDYRERFGMETDQPTLAGDLGVRALGVLTDVGNSASFGILGRNFADKQRINAENDLAAQQARYAAHNASKQAAAVLTDPPKNTTNKPSVGSQMNDALYGNAQTATPPQTSVNNPPPTTQQAPTSNNDPYAVQQKGNAFSYANPSAAAQARANGMPETSSSGFVNVQPVRDSKAVANLMANTREMGASEQQIQNALAQREMNLGMQGYGGIRYPSAPQRTPEQEAERQQIMNELRTPYRGSQNGQLTARQFDNIVRMQTGDDDRAQQRYVNDANNATSQFNNSMNNATSLMNNTADNAANMAQTGMREQGANARALLGEQGQNGRFNAQLGFDAQKFNATNDLANREFNLNATEKGFGIRNSQRIEKLYEMYDKASTDEDKAAIQQRINRYTGGDKLSGRDRYMTVGGGQEWNEQAGTMVNRSQQLFDTQTQQYVDAPQNQSQQNGKASYNEGQVYTDGNGNKAVYRNGQFQPVG